MFYAAFPPEINSGRMYAGPGSGPMLSAATAWDGLAAELQSIAASCASVINSVTSGPWVGPSSLAMATAAAPYLTWLQSTAATAAQAGTQAAAAVSAYETAFAAHVPPPEIAANRSQLALLVATNLFGQNTAAIAATEAQYGEMWAQDAVAMDSYASSSAAASQVTPFTEPPQVVSAAGLASQAVAAGQAAGTSSGTTAQAITASGGPISWLLQLGADLSTGYNQAVSSLLNTLFGPTGASTYISLFTAVRAPLGFTTGFNDIGLLVNFPASQFLKFAPHSAAGGLAQIPKDALGGGLGLAPHWGRGWLTSATPGDVTAHWGRGTLVGSLTAPPSWAAATPAIRTVAAALTAAGPEAVPAAALGEGGLLSSMSLAGMLGSAFGAGAPSAVNRAGARGHIAPLKDLKDATSPEKLKRLVAQISEKPESVQHHRVDPEGLDSLLEQLAKKPGIHAVHLSKGDKPKVVPSDTQLG
ncbi:PPE family protein [Mycobacterium simiae]|uniref:PPE family protein n=1 Tax=Mycobacterium simiae TaxID=1784 RepID=A0A5B1BRA6_MYCSI|nr:PPE family protein [Mycobacterium simiae]KAA1250926.1 PPE family protein [Mycobacterium simiae]